MKVNREVMRRRHDCFSWHLARFEETSSIRPRAQA
jgi:hypothetical protein